MAVEPDEQQIAAFKELAFDPEVERMRAERATGLERARLICCAPGSLA